MAYLDKDGIPRVSENIQRYNDCIDDVIHRLDDIQEQLNYVFNAMPDSRWQTDAQLAEYLDCCNRYLNACKDRCQMYTQFG